MAHKPRSFTNQEILLALLSGYLDSRMDFTSSDAFSPNPAGGSFISPNAVFLYRNHVDVCVWGFVLNVPLHEYKATWAGKVLPLRVKYNDKTVSLLSPEFPDE